MQRPRPPIQIGGGTQPTEKVYGQTVRSIDPVLRWIAKCANAWIPHSSATVEMVKSDWNKIQFYAVRQGRDPQAISRVYSSFVWVLRPGELAATAVPHFAAFSGMDLDY